MNGYRYIVFYRFSIVTYPVIMIILRYIVFLILILEHRNEDDTLHDDYLLLKSPDFTAILYGYIFDQIA